MLRNIYKTLIITAILASGIIFTGADSVLAQSDLGIEFERTPLFQEANFLPGEGITRWIKVTNSGLESQRIAIETINESDPDNFASQLNLTIKEGSSILYNDTLANFFDDGEVYLSDLAGGGATTQYDLTIVFNSGSGNDYQEKAVGFDILIGFQGEGGNGDNDFVTDGGSDPLVRGGGTLPQGLTILSESVVTTNLTGCESCSITINWNTNYFSTSRVVYSKEGEPHSFDLYALNYGYANSKEGDDSLLEKVTAHSVTLTGLSPNTNYYFRCESHASPPTITGEFNFNTVTSENCANQETGENQEGGDNSASNFLAFGGETGGNQEPEGDESAAGNGGEGTEEELKKENNKGGFPDFLSGGLASLLDVIGKISGNWLIILLLIIILLLLFLLFKRRKKEEK